jgi:hypothetical protein
MNSLRTRLIIFTVIGVVAIVSVVAVARAWRNERRITRPHETPWRVARGIDRSAAPALSQHGQRQLAYGRLTLASLSKPEGARAATPLR